MNRFAVKAPNGRFVYGSESETMIDAIYAGADHHDQLAEAVWDNGIYDDEAIRKRAKRAGFQTVAVRMRSK
jgi:hypothetical protein